MKGVVVARVEKHIIKPTDKFHLMVSDFCFKAKNLYNHANFIIRQEFIENENWIRYATLDKMLRNDDEYPDYKSMPTAQSAQQILRLVDKNWKSFFTSIKDWNKHKEKYSGRPKMPKYLKKDGKFVLILTNQECRLKDGNLKFPKSFNGFSIKPEFIKRENFESFRQVRFIPHKSRIVVELIYTISISEIKCDNHRYIGIDIGVDNLATVCNNVDKRAFAVNGRPLKSINQFYNKRISHYRQICKRMNSRDYSERMNRLTEKRNAKIEDYLHKASRYIIRYCQQHKINTVVIGRNKGWKQNSVFSKKLNQNFIQIPFARFIEMIQYKAEEAGITVILTEESYTSGTSFIDNEEPVKKNYDKTRRIHRGLFISNQGTIINADLNGAYQILKKVVPIKWDRGCVVHPVVVNVI